MRIYNKNSNTVEPLHNEQCGKIKKWPLVRGAGGARVKIVQHKIKKIVMSSEVSISKFI